MIDVTIIGAGLTGLSMAAVLAQQGRSVALIDQGPRPSTALSWGRVNAYNGATEALLRSVGAWDQIPDPLRSAFDQVWVGQEAQGAMVFDATLVERQHLGHFMPNSVVSAALVAMLEAHDAVQLHWQCRPLGWVTRDASLSLKLNDQSIETALLIGADGQRSWVRDQCAIAWTPVDFGQHCIVGTVHFEGDHQRCAWQRFLPSGPLGLLPLNAQRYSLAWSALNAEAERWMALDDVKFLECLMSKRLPAEIRRLTHIEGRAAFPLKGGYAHAYVGHRVALIGDAVHAVHPLAGLGANMGFKDVMVLAQCLEGVKMAEIASALRRYERQQKPFNQALSQGLRLINTAFTQSNPALAWMRGAGLSVGQRLPFMKRWMMQQALWLA